MREDIEELKKEVEEVKSESFAMELLRDERKANKRMFIMWIITFIGLILSVGINLYLSNDTGTIEEDTIDIKEVDKIKDADIQIGDR